MSPAGFSPELTCNSVKPLWQHNRSRAFMCPRNGRDPRRAERARILAGSGLVRKLQDEHPAGAKPRWREESANGLSTSFVTYESSRRTCNKKARHCRAFPLWLVQFPPARSLGDWVMELINEATFCCTRIKRRVKKATDRATETPQCAFIRVHTRPMIATMFRTNCRSCTMEWGMDAADAIIALSHSKLSLSAVGQKVGQNSSAFKNQQA